MYDLSIFNEASNVKELQEAFAHIQQPRTNYVIEHFVVGALDTPEQQYCQCVLELQIKYDNIRRAILGRRKIEIEIEKMREKDDEVTKIDCELKQIDLEEQDRAMLGAIREFQALYSLWQKSPKFTREQIDAAQEHYWNKRLARQANQDLLAMGRVGQGNQEALQQIGIKFEELQAISAQGKLLNLSRVSEIEKRYLEVGNTKILIVVPSEKKSDDLPVLAGLEIPSGAQIKKLNIHGAETAAAYNQAAKIALEDKADFMLCIEDDTYPPSDALHKLLALARKETKSVVGAWYPKRNSVKEGTPLVIKDGIRKALEADGQIHTVYTIPQGCTLIPVSVFREIESPWFITTSTLSQDSFFSQLAREAGYTLLVDTSIRCVHKDRVTGKEYK